ncbi:uncharacterized protein LOC141787129 [Halichoeres trimaculatus]|uniref:uncharacterized protein LOC141787129 n=1 Tax=Halichoeres trimaculatus TaxID=147232 RepID=UPI003D9E6F27
MAKMAQVQQIVEATQISIKVKLRRRTKEEAWEVVNLQDKDKTLAVLTPVLQDDSNQKSPQSDPSSDASPPSSAQPGSVSLLKTSLPQHASTDPAAPQSSPSSESQILSVCFSPNPSDSLQSVPLPQPPVEDTDEQIGKMLEDIMIGLNILPPLETSSKRSHHPQQSNDQASTSCQIQHVVNDGAQGQVHAGDGAAGYWCYQDFGTQIGLSSTDTGQIQRSCSSLTSLQLDVVHTQQQQCSLQNQLSVTSPGQRGELSHQGVMALSKGQTLNHEVATSASAFSSSVHKQHHPECREQSSQHDLNILEFLPPAARNQAQPLHSFSLLCFDELRLPPLLSPLESSDSTSQPQPAISDSTYHSAETQPQPSSQGPSWLTETPGCLRFPLSAITPKDNQSGSLPQDKSSKCWKKRSQKELKLIPHSEGAQAVSSKEKEKRTMSSQVASRKSNIKKDVKCKQSDTRVNVRKRKRKLPSEPNSSLPCKELKFSDGKEIQLNLSDCSVSLSSNNVLAKERELANIYSHKSFRFTGKPNEPLVVTESQEIRRPLVRARTRRYLIRPEATQSNPNQEQTSVLGSKPTAKQRRGRPRKIKHRNSQESSSLVTEQNNNSVQGEPHVNNNLSKEEKDEDKRKRKGRKRKRNRGEVEVDPPKTTSAAESTGTAEADVNQNMNPAEKKPRRPRKVTLKEFQKLIKQQHFKTRKSKESQDKETNTQSIRKAEGEGKAEDNIPTDNTEEVNTAHSMYHGTVDVNHNQIVNESASELSESQQDDRRSSGAEGVSLFDTEQSSVFSFTDLGEEVEKLAAEREQPLRNLHQAYDQAESDTTHGRINGNGSHIDPHQPQDDSLDVGHGLCPQGTVWPLMETDDCDKQPGCAQREVDEDEEEVDVLLYSPDRVPQTTRCENGLGNVDLSLEEDEDEDVKEIDVTGDEAD